MSQSQTASSLFVYSTPPPRFIEELAGAFRKRHPEIETRWDHAPAAPFLKRTLEEIEQGRCPADVMMLNRQQAEVLKRRGFLQPYRSPESAPFPARCHDPDGFGTQVFMVPFSLAYNTERLAAPDVPRRYQDLLEPRWSGKLLFPDPARSGSGAGWYMIMKERLGEAFLRRLAMQNLICKHPAEECLAEGDGLVLIAAIVDRIERLKTKGAPVDWTPMPIMMVGGPHAVLFRHARNPDAGKKWIDFLHSEEGQEIMSRYHIPNRPGVTIHDPVFASVLRRLEGRALTPFTAKDAAEYEADLSECVRLFAGKQW
ncbi:MAG TPA: ABC transporter substrate-binding protein [Candidatus Acidoferrales bacterium]|nr:ABC transporter substrate-binding protein [Candidatus Acidoferrales bacterium]